MKFSLRAATPLFCLVAISAISQPTPRLDCQKQSSAIGYNDQGRDNGAGAGVSQSEEFNDIVYGSPNSGTHVSTHLGFDTACVPSTALMKVWMQASPYYDVGIYLPGSENGPLDANLIKGWIVQVVGYGWGLLPLWVGLQAPCSSPSYAQFSEDSAGNYAEAYQQGYLEASKARKSAVQDLGITAEIIYFDLEYYSPTDTQCDQAAGRFIQGWTNGMHAIGYLGGAGVYGAVTNAANDWLGVPDEVWLKTWDSSGDGPVTIWGLLQGKDGEAWLNDARAAQFKGSPSGTYRESWGGQGPWKVDLDVEDAPAAGASNAFKSYSFSISQIQYGNATSTFPGGINNLGQIVGMYLDSGGHYHGFLNIGSSFVSFDYPQSAGTQAASINSRGRIVGSYEDTQGYYHAFKATEANGNVGAFTPMPCPGAVNCYPSAVNDSSQVVGTYTDSTGNNHGFLFDPTKPTQQFVTIDYPNQQNTVLTGINGDRLIVGFYTDSSQIDHGFVYTDNTTDPQFELLGGCLAYSGPVGINNNGHIISFVNNETYFFSDGNCAYINYSGASVTFPTGMNDRGQLANGKLVREQVVGYYFDSGANAIGFLATPN